MEISDLERLSERARFIRTETIRLIEIAKSGHYTSVFVAEEQSTRGGVATIVADAIVDAGMREVRLVRIGLPPDEYASIGPPYHLYKHYGLDAAGLAERIRKVLQ